MKFAVVRNISWTVDGRTAHGARAPLDIWYSGKTTWFSCKQWKKIFGQETVQPPPPPPRTKLVPYAYESIWICKCSPVDDVIASPLDPYILYIQFRMVQFYRPNDLCPISRCFECTLGINEWIMRVISTQSYLHILIFVMILVRWLW